MSHVVGIDLSSKALDLVKLSEETNRAEWVRCELTGKTAWERTLTVKWSMRESALYNWSSGGFWDDVYLVAIEAPYGRGQAGTNAILNRVVGAVAASLPAALRAPERCWIVRPDEWKTGLGLKAKPTGADIGMLMPDLAIRRPDLSGFYSEGDAQNGRDALCIAKFARDTNARAVETAA